MTVAHLAVKTIDGSVSAPAGFRSAGVACGIKKTGALDVALIASDTTASAAAVFTTNKAQAAPVTVSQQRLRASSGRARAVAINSGCANACTGPHGHATAEAMADATAAAVGASPAEVLIASTGVIGVALDRERVTSGILSAAAALSRDGANAAKAIMTTDPFPKEAAVELTTPAGTFRVGGIAKGSGMIEPLMATMLAVVTTDAAVAPGLLQRALAAVTEVTFNAITVDGECSTNDCVFALANGASGVTLGEGQFDLIVEALRLVCEPLAIGIVRGGEGATKLVTVEVTGGRTAVEAKRAARAIANSPLVKTAVHGADPNWGRLVAVAGRAGVEFALDRARVQIGDVELFAGGRPFDERAEAASKHLQGKDVRLHVDLGTGGNGSARMWGCDLSADYVKINAEYRT